MTRRSPTVPWRDNRSRDPAVDHYAEAVFSERGRCWRFVYRGPDNGRPARVMTSSSTSRR
jgi:hypothetical protein